MLRLIAGFASAFALLSSATVLAQSPATSEAPAAPAVQANDYSKPEFWLCRGGAKDGACAVDLSTTIVAPSGKFTKEKFKAPKDAPIDCFYVYPTVSRDASLNSDMSPGIEEQGTAAIQLGRFASVCKTYAPIYRQMTLGSVAAFAAGADVTGPAMLAYSDVANAWRTYLAKYNKGRPFVLIGHSQGSLMLQQIIANEIEGKPVAKQMTLAILPGYNLLVPVGKRVGGTLKSTPICGSPTETGCVMTWVSFREKNAPPEGAIFGRAGAGMTVACTNPVRPGSTKWEPLDSYWSSRWSLPVPGGPIQWSTEGAPPSDFLRTEGLVSAKCVNQGPLGYLSIRTNVDPNDKRTDRIYGEVGMLGMFIPGWGMHLADVAEAQGDMIRRVEEISAQPRTVAQP